MKNVSPEEIIKLVLDESFRIHTDIGPGMLENVYMTCLSRMLSKQGLHVETEKAVPVVYEGVKMACGYRADIVVEDCVVVEVKAIEAIGQLQVAQVLTYLRFLQLRYGLIINFHALHLKDGIKRIVNGY